MTSYAVPWDGSDKQRRQARREAMLKNSLVDSLVAQCRPLEKPISEINGSPSYLAVKDKLRKDLQEMLRESGESNSTEDVATLKECLSLLGS